MKKKKKVPAVLPLANSLSENNSSTQAMAVVMWGQVADSAAAGLGVYLLINADARGGNEVIEELLLAADA